MTTCITFQWQKFHESGKKTQDSKDIGIHWLLFKILPASAIKTRQRIL